MRRLFRVGVYFTVDFAGILIEECYSLLYNALIIEPAVWFKMVYPIEMEIFMHEMHEKIFGGLVGHAVGDALGVSAEFHSRNELRENPVIDMLPIMSFHSVPIVFQPAGTWSDDTSMTLALADSLIEMGKYDAEDTMRRYSAWYNKGDYTPFGEMWDCGNTSSAAIEKYDKGVPVDKCGGDSEHDNGNGSIMRILPLAFYLHSIYDDYSKHDNAFCLTHLVSSLTHAHIRSQIACGIYLMIAGVLFSQRDIFAAVSQGIQNATTYYEKNQEYTIELINFTRLFMTDFAELAEGDIKSGGYVVETLEAAIWCLLNTSNYADCVLRAVNLGDDADTTAAVVGGLAGIHYGFAAIPEKWISSLQKKEYVLDLYKRFADTFSDNEVHSI